jgi:hypothetical protein
MAKQCLNQMNKPDEKETGKMKRNSYFRFAQLGLLALMLSLSASAAQAQTTSFTYQGSLNDNGSPANGPYDLQFKLFDALTGGAQQGSTILRDDIQVTNGTFSVTLDFGAAAFPGANRFLEISVRAGASTGAYTTLSPRQQVTSTPYAIKSLGAATADGLSTACVNCVTSSQIQSLPTGSGNYIQNATSQQASANFNISGNGTAGGTLNADTVNATTQYNLGGSRVLSIPGSGNVFAGPGAGQSNTTGASNAFFGLSAGFSNTTGASNAFFGRNAGFGSTAGSNNSFFGFNTGPSNAGGNNSFFGANAGVANTTGGNNTVIGAGANVASGALNFATAIGAGATVSTSNTVALGRNLDTVQVPGALTVTGTLTASGAGLTGLNATNITTGTLAAARGGTGLSAVGAAGNYLRSDGATWTSSALPASDIPSGSANYIQNRTTQQAGTNFNISGNGTVGGTLSAGKGVFSSSSGAGVSGSTAGGGGSGSAGVFGRSTALGGIGVSGTASGSNASGVYGDSSDGVGVFGNTVIGVGVFGKSFGGYAGYFAGDVGLDNNKGIYMKNTTGAPMRVLFANPTFNILHIGSGGGQGFDQIDFDLGTAGNVMSLLANGTTKVKVLQISGADLAEPFDVSGVEAIEPGLVVAIDPDQPGKLRVADKAYDRTVAGIVSGANGIRTGLTLRQEGTIADGSHPVALTGRVYCRADASNGPIEPGDLLTTSDLPGHAMKVTDHAKAQGAIIGKAMTSLREGRGLVFVLVSLQ